MAFPFSEDVLYLWSLYARRKPDGQWPIVERSALGGDGGRAAPRTPCLPTGATQLSQGVVGQHFAISSLRIQVAPGQAKESVPAIPESN